jgi:CheY-like chemotaxis protein
MIVDPNADARRLLEGLFGKENANTISAAKFNDAADKARREVPQIDLIVLASDMDAPTAQDALAALRKDDRLELSPVVLIVKPGGMPVAVRALAADKRVERVVPAKFAGLSDAETTALHESLMSAWGRGRKNYGRQSMTDERALELSMQAADALRLVAVTGTSVFQFAGAEPALIRACSHPDERMRIKAAAVLAWANSPGAQSAIAKLALDTTGSEAQRITVLGILAESAKRFGRRMADDLVNSLTDQALHESVLTIRTAASQALGAMNLASDRAAEIIRSQSAE